MGRYLADQRKPLRTSTGGERSTVRASLPVQTSQSAASSGRSVDREATTYSMGRLVSGRDWTPSMPRWQTCTLPLGARREWHPRRRDPLTAGRCPPISAIRDSSPAAPSDVRADSFQEARMEEATLRPRCAPVTSVSAWTIGAQIPRSTRTLAKRSICSRIPSPTVR